MTFACSDKIYMSFDNFVTSNLYCNCFIVLHVFSLYVSAIDLVLKTGVKWVYLRLK